MSEPAHPLYQRVLREASEFMASFKDHTVEVLTVDKPPDLDYAIHLAKVISKLSPMLGNTIEYRLCAELNKKGGWPEGGRWMRQDPGFPDTIFAGTVSPTPGIEIKTWFPLATEITARFKDSITHFADDQTNVAMLAWIPEGIIYGRPKLIDVWVDSARSVAMARDLHYHRPPGYLVFEPEDTSARTRNLQQTNTNGYKFQGTPEQLREAQRVVESWGSEAKKYSFLPEYQGKLKALMGRFPYRLDTNFAKMDRIEHKSLETFKARVEATVIRGHSIKQWKRILKFATDDESPDPASVKVLQELIA
ncbi:MAG: hypothetical protein K2P78_02405 [Gemmataceae bacterium]|nr:hypothetical protein [Gemmataceae bacterium]